MKKWIVFIIIVILFFIWYFKQNMNTFVEVESLESDDNVGIGATSDPRSGGFGENQQEGDDEEGDDEEGDDEEEEEKKDNKCVSSSDFRCIANNGTDIGDSVCCGQTGKIRTTKYNCPISLPYCKGYKCGEKWGVCTKNK